MRIKELEEVTGMTRANVRFYEKEGLLEPHRAENGYREYSEADVETLMKVKLLRTIHMSLDEIKELHHGNRALVDALEQLSVRLEQEKENVESSQSICRSICEDRATYRTLDAQRYLDRMNEGNRIPPAAASDAAPRVYIPWRRYFARMLDYAVYQICWMLFLAVCFHANIAERNVLETALDTAMAYTLMIFIEPALLSLTGATLGKWIFGIRVMHPDDRYLTYREAMERTAKACLYGLGYSVPVYILYRLWVSYKAYGDGKPLQWEQASVISEKAMRPWRVAAFVGIDLLLAGLIVAAVQLSAMPTHRGDITVAEFCENYNHYAEYYNEPGGYILDEAGKWTRANSTEYYVEFFARPEFVFEETDGKMTGIEFTVLSEDGDENLSTYLEERILAVLAFVKAQDSYPVFSWEVDRLAERMREQSIENHFSEDICGITVSYDMELSNMSTDGLLIFSQEGREQDAKCRIHFEVRKKV